MNEYDKMEIGHSIFDGMEKWREKHKNKKIHLSQSEIQVLVTEVSK